VREGDKKVERLCKAPPGFHYSLLTPNYSLNKDISRCWMRAYPGVGYGHIQMLDTGISR
jgi:hypothetical protein